MSMTLPYRTDAEDLNRFLDALARGRELDQIQTLNFSRKAFEGTITAAQVLGFIHEDGSDLTEVGRKYVLAADRDRRGALLEAMKEFEPYGLLLEALAARGETVTPTEWIEAWWSTHGFGSSGTNRAEGSTAFSRLLEYVELGTYLQGRRGHPSRIEWRPGALASLAARPVPESAGPEADAGEKEKPSRPAEADSVLTPEPGGADGATQLRLPLSGGRLVHIQVPPRVTAAEKARIISLLELLIAEAPEDIED